MSEMDTGGFERMSSPPVAAPTDSTGGFERIKPAAPQGPAPGPVERFGMGVTTPIEGLAQGAAHMGAVLPPAGMPEFGQYTPDLLQPRPTAAGIDKAVQGHEQQYQRRRAAAGQTGTDWYRGAGDLLSSLGISAPFAAAVPEVGGASLLARLGVGAATGAGAGAASAAMEPVTKGDFARQKLDQSIWGAGSGAVLGTVLAPLGHALGADDPAAAERFVIDAYRRYVKPSTAGISTAGQLEKSLNAARDAIGSVVREKPNLVLTDESGNAIKGQLPGSLDQAAQAIEQTKQAVFDRYDKMAKAAGESGVMIGLMPAVNELREIAGSISLKTARPEVADYAEKMAARLEKQTFISPADAQKTIKYYNDSLKAFYRQPSYDRALNAMVDGLVANNLRAGLDTTIADVVAPGYQALKREYGALRAIEDQVVKRAQVSGRQFPGGGLLGIFGNLWSGEQLVRSALTLDPASLARAAATKGFVEMMKYLRSPDRAIRRMFETAERLEKMAPSSAVRQAAQGAAEYLPFGAGSAAGTAAGANQ